MFSDRIKTLLTLTSTLIIYLAVVGVLMHTDTVPCDHVTEFGGVQNVQQWY